MTFWLAPALMSPRIVWLLFCFDIHAQNLTAPNAGMSLNLVVSSLSEASFYYARAWLASVFKEETQ